MDTTTPELNNIIKNFSLDDLKKWLIILISILIVIAIILFLIDHFSNYKRDKIQRKILIRTAGNSVGGGQEAFLRYWVWQRKKRKLIRTILVAQYPNVHGIYPKQKWLKRGKVRFIFRRECWVIL